jgi:predicted CXXCH cytochrome family protein
MATCVVCHEKEAKYHELGPHGDVTLRVNEEDPAGGEGCESCHGPGSLHVEAEGREGTIIREDPRTCFRCHLEVYGKLQLQHHHPVLEGQVNCSDCHQPHGKDVMATAGTMLRRWPDEKCFKCHKEMKGPFVFEHDAMQTTTCLRCHWQVSFNAAAGGFGGGIIHGAGGGNYDIGRGEECVDHHRAPHGSNIWRTFNR